MTDRAEDKEHPQRRYERRTILIEAKVMEEGQWHDCIILNISAGGAKIKTTRRFAQGLALQLEINRFGRFGGTVLWQSGEEIGMKFNHDPTEMAEVVMGLAMYG